MDQEQPIRTIVIDVLKPHRPNLVDFGKAICNELTVTSADLSVYAVDERTESVKVILEGTNINFDAIKKLVEEFGAVVHSIDKVVVGKKQA